MNRDTIFVAAEYLEAPALLRLASCASWTAGCLSDEVVLRAAFLGGASAPRKTLGYVVELYRLGQVCKPSPLRLLRLANGKRCEVRGCRSTASRGAATVSGSLRTFGVFCCWKCTLALTTEVEGDSRDAPERAYFHPRACHSTCAGIGGLWTEPFHSGGERAGPALTLAEHDGPMIVRKVAHGDENYHAVVDAAFPGERRPPDDADFFNRFDRFRRESAERRRAKRRAEFERIRDGRASKLRAEETLAAARTMIDEKMTELLGGGAARRSIFLHRILVHLRRSPALVTSATLWPIAEIVGQHWAAAERAYENADEPAGPAAAALADYRRSAGDDWLRGAPPETFFDLSASGDVVAADVNRCWFVAKDDERGFGPRRDLERAFARAVEKDRPGGLARAVFFDVLGATDRAFVTFPRRGPPSPAELEEIWAKAAGTYAAVRAAALDFANELTLSAEFAGTDWAPLLAGLWDPDCGQLAVACLRTRQFAPLRAKLLASIAPA